VREAIRNWLPTRWYDSLATASSTAGSLLSPFWHALSAWLEMLSRSTRAPVADCTSTPDVTSASAVL
jgi:hypothetical protein